MPRNAVAQTAIAVESFSVLPSTSQAKSPQPFIYVAACIAALSAVAYELMLATYATYLLGATVLQYSIVISTMMASMGLGAWLTGKTQRNAIQLFCLIEAGLAIVALLALPALYIVFASHFPPQPFLFFFVVLIGIAVGTEIPLLNQMASDESQLPRILFFDYFGGFLGGLLFPLWLQPKLGLFPVAGILSFLNVCLAVGVLFRKDFKGNRMGWGIALGCLALLALGFIHEADPLRQFLENHFFQIQSS